MYEDGATGLELYAADLHVHVGRSEDGRLVKVSSPASMTLRSVLETARFAKGLDMVAVVDGHSPAVRDDVQRLLDAGELAVDGSVLSYHGLGLILGSEVEAHIGGKRVHLVVLFPHRAAADDFARFLRSRVNNPVLSTPLWSGSWTVLADWADEVGGLFFPAHIFTPHRGLLAAGLADARPVLGRSAAVELGLSADTGMADDLADLGPLCFLSNSDAHSQDRIAREFNVFALARPAVEELVLAVRGLKDRRVVANYGLDPALGKYHRTWCSSCGHINTGPAPKTACELCGSTRVVLGVKDRVALLAATGTAGTAGRKPSTARPPYIHQVPLLDIPGLGKKTYSRLLEAFGSERAVLHDAPAELLQAVCGEDLATKIVAARQAQVQITPGGGGHWGRMLW